MSSVQGLEFRIYILGSGLRIVYGFSPRSEPAFESSRICRSLPMSSSGEERHRLTSREGHMNPWFEWLRILDLGFIGRGEHFNSEMVFLCLVVAFC